MGDANGQFAESPSFEQPEEGLPWVFGTGNYVFAALDFALCQPLRHVLDDLRLMVAEVVKTARSIACIGQRHSTRFSARPEAVNLRVHQQQRKSINLVSESSAVALSCITWQGSAPRIGLAFAQPHICRCCAEFPEAISTMWLNPRHRRNLLKIIPFGIMWCAFGLMYVLIEYGLLGDATEYPSTKNPYDFHSALLVTPVFAFVIGSLLGAAEIVFMNKLFIHRPFWQKIVFKTMVYLVAILAMLVGISLATSVARHGVTMFDPLVLESLGAFLGNFAFWSIVIYAGCMILVSLYVSETSDYLGGNVFGNFFTGRYHRPVEEERVFMFLDMKSSTTIAEKLGHSTYFLLLNQYYSDTTNAIIDTWGEVYQYAGDEIIVSWSLERGLEHNNCIRCFFKLKQAFENEASVYREKYGLVPEFKAGFHCGTVTTGEIGALKKELFFTGDVMNTTARVQSKCNELEVDLLISEDLASRLSLDGSYALISKGKFELRGKQEKTSLFTLVEVAQ